MRICSYSRTCTLLHKYFKLAVRSYTAGDKLNKRAGLSNQQLESQASIQVVLVWPL